MVRPTTFYIHAADCQYDIADIPRELDLQIFRLDVFLRDVRDLRDIIRSIGMPATP